MKRALNILKWVFLGIYFPLMLSFVSVSSRSTICIDVNVVIRDSIEAGFVSAADIRSSILDKYPDLLGSPINKIDFYKMESFVNEHTAIKTTQVYNTARGVLQVMVNQHQPIVRVFAPEGTYYLDLNGQRIPVSNRFTARVLVANGHIPADKSDLVNVSRLIATDPFWNAQMEQIYIRRNNEYILVPRVGEHWILLGQPERVEQKLAKLKALYKQGLDPLEWNEYQLINLKYENQVICSRNRDL
ncbi:cell division protein FtsQ/DivIB [Alkalitalea saponilacus]|nr:cell division protein FtsQ [Alkalitalea saponilacus]ASB48392.1 cell division protein FtsQ [Alkalitalea saponilacus]